MIQQLEMSDLYVFILAGFLGFYLIAKVPALLHTPLMSATNAISGISVVGAILVAGSGQDNFSAVLGCIAIFLSTVNVVGGFLITDRILKMFKKEDRKS